MITEPVEMASRGIKRRREEDEPGTQTFDLTYGSSCAVLQRIKDSKLEKYGFLLLKREIYA